MHEIKLWYPQTCFVLFYTVQLEEMLRDKASLVSLVMKNSRSV